VLGVLFGLFDQAFDGHGVDDHLAVAVRLEGHAGGALGENGAGETRVGGAVFADSEFAFDGAEEDESTSSTRYRTQRRGGKGLRDIKATTRNGPVIGICRVDEDDEVLVMTERGKIQRIRVAEIRLVGRNTQGVRIMSLDESDALTAIVRVPKEDAVDGVVAVEETDGAALLDSDREAASLPSPELAIEEEIDGDIDGDINGDEAGSDEGTEDEV